MTLQVCLAAVNFHGLVSFEFKKHDLVLKCANFVVSQHVAVEFTQGAHHSGCLSQQRNANVPTFWTDNQI